MLRFLLAVLCVAFVAHNAAWAEGEKQCNSITSIEDNDCTPLPRVSVGHDYRVEIFTRQRTIFFPVPHGDDGEELRLICTSGKCECSEHVQFFEFKGPHQSFRVINDVERSAAGKTQCSLENASVTRDAVAFAISPHLISTAISELEYCHGCGGSCHGSTKLATYDEQDGRLLHVGDFLKTGAADALRRHMIEFAIAKYGAAAGDAYIRKQLGEELARRSLLDEGIYAEHGTLYINLDSFVLGCAGGSFYPIPIPAELLTASIARRLE